MSQLTIEWNIPQASGARFIHSVWVTQYRTVISEYTHMCRTHAASLFVWNVGSGACVCVCVLVERTCVYVGKFHAGLGCIKYLILVLILPSGLMGGTRCLPLALRTHIRVALKRMPGSIMAELWASAPSWHFRLKFLRLMPRPNVGPWHHIITKSSVFYSIHVTQELKQNMFQRHLAWHWKTLR